MSDPDVVWVGIDAGKNSHHAVAVDGEGRQLWPVKVAGGQQPAEELIARAALILVTGFATPAEVRQAGHDSLTACPREHGAWRKGISVMAAAVRSAAEQSAALPGEARTAMLVKQPAGQLLDLDLEIKDAGKLITGRFRAHPQNRITESLPGTGPVPGAKFLAATGSHVQAAFASPGRLASYARLVPVAKDSGRITGNWRRPRRYNRALRRVCYMTTLSSPRTDSPSKTFCQPKRAEHRIHTQALPALGRRLADVLRALLRDNRTFSTISPLTAAAA